MPSGLAVADLWVLKVTILDLAEFKYQFVGFAFPRSEAVVFREWNPVALCCNAWTLGSGKEYEIIWILNYCLNGKKKSKVCDF